MRVPRSGRPISPRRVSGPWIIADDPFDCARCGTYLRDRPLLIDDIRAIILDGDGPVAATTYIEDALHDYHDSHGHVERAKMDRDVARLRRRWKGQES